MAAATPSQWNSWLVWACLALYTLVRLSWAPGAGASGFGHDSAYVAIVADNLLAGHGYVNDAHWLVFLLPDRLPMPYHNANPLYPTFTAAVAWTTGQDTVHSGFVVSAVASSVLFAAFFVLTAQFVQPVWQRAALAAAGTFFPPIYEDSLSMVPDALCTSLTAWFVVCLICGWGSWAALSAGIIFGLAWLTRSSAVLVLPAAVVYICLRDGWRVAFARGAVFAIAAGVVVSPWLIHTALVWGNPLRSDAGYYLLQDYHARHFDGSTERFWHSTTPPPGLVETIKGEPAEFAAFYLVNMPILLKNTLAGWTKSNYIIAGLLVALTGLAVWHVKSRVNNKPALIAIAVYFVTAVLVLTPRASSLEVRYLAPLSVILATVLMWAALDAWTTRPRSMSNWALLICGAAWWLLWTPLADGLLTLDIGEHHRERYYWIQDAREVAARFGQNGPVVVGDHPYFFTHATGTSSLAIPNSDDAFLLDYMRRYGARWIVLDPVERHFWRPHWEQLGGLPPQLRQVAITNRFVVYERTD